MILEITEEEREFLETLCTRAQIYAMKGFAMRPKEMGVEEIRALKMKFFKSEIEIET